MPRVPYQPFSTAQPQFQGEKIDISTPGAAFGENIGAALQHLGGTEEQVGGELWDRAIALQDLANENSARDAQTKFAQGASQLHADYSAKTGLDAKQSLPKFLEDQANLRTSIRDGLGSPMAQKYYDADSLPFLQRNVFSAAGHAAEENKKYTLETLASDATLASQAAAQHPDDENFVSQQRNRIRQNIEAYAFGFYGTTDPNNPNVVKNVDNALSSQRAEQILSKAKTDAITAQQWFGKYASDLTNPADMMRVQSAIEGHAATVAAEHVSNTVTNAHRQPDGSFDVSERVMADEARAAAEKALPGNELAGATAVAKLKGFLGNDSWLRTQDEREARDQLNQILQKGDLRDAHQMMLYPDMDKIMAKMPTVRTVDQLQTYMNRFYGSVDKQTNEYWATLINGMRTSDAAAFQYLDPTDPKYHLHTDDIIKIQNQQAAAASNPKNDAKVSQAMTWLLGARGTELNTLKVDRFNKDDPNDYYHFRGAMQEALQEWAEDHKRPPTYEEVVDKIGPQIIKTQAVAKGWIYNTNVPAFRQYEKPSLEDMTDQDRQRLTKMFTDKGGAPPDDKQLIRAYAREQFQKFYKQAKPSGSDQPNQ